MVDLIRPAPLPRRLAAALYDGMLLLALWMVAALIAVAIAGGEAAPVGSRLFQASLLLIGGLFNGWFWTHGGQTLGMRAWRLQLRRRDGGALHWFDAALRYVIAVPAWLLGGIGVWWSLLPPQHQSWQDLASGTETILLPPPKPQ